MSVSSTGTEDEESSLIYSLADKSSRKVKGQIGMVSEIHGFGLSHNNYPASKHKALDRKPAEVILMDTENASTQTLLNKQQMLAIHPRRSVDRKSRIQRSRGFRHPKWSPDGSHFFWVYMLELKGTNTKIVKSALLSDREGKRITYVSEIGQHPMWYQEESLLSYVRRDGFDHFDNPSAQDIMEHPIDGSPGKPIVSEAIGIHGSPSPDGTSPRTSSTGPNKEATPFCSTISKAETTAFCSHETGNRRSQELHAPPPFVVT